MEARASYVTAVLRTWSHMAWICFVLHVQPVPLVSYKGKVLP